MGKSRPEHLPYLDGLRGIAAAWILLHHIAIFASIRLPLIANGELAVDLFMLLSGSLMAFHYLGRQERRPWQEASTWIDFWSRRFFRIASLYYLLLVVALLAGPWLAEARNTIAEVYPQTATPVSRYLDQSPANWLTHISFVFGILPDYSFRTPLPDWSIGLEMQFYAAFPFIMLLWKWVGPMVAAITLVLACAAFKQIFPSYFLSFMMPSMLVIKLYVFLTGSLLAAALMSSGWNQLILAAFAVVLPVFAWIVRLTPRADALPQVLLALLFAGVVLRHRLTPVPLVAQAFDLVVRVMDTQLLRWLGDTSYSVYLLHLLIVLPVGAWLVGQDWYADLPGLARLGLLVLISAPVIYALATMLFHGVEKPGITLGKRLLQSRAKAPVQAAQPEASGGR